MYSRRETSTQSVSLKSTLLFDPRRHRRKLEFVVDMRVTKTSGGDFCTDDVKGNIVHFGDMFKN